MHQYIVLLRGINVGGKNKLLMADLKALLNSNGYANVSTYIQSGNIILSSDNSRSVISKHIKQLIETEFSYNIPVIAISTTDLKKCFLENPHLKHENDIKFLHVTFLNDTPEQSLLEKVSINTNDTETYQIIGNCIYLHTPDGFAKTKFTNTQFEKKLNTVATTRNWRTVTKLVELCT